MLWNPVLGTVARHFGPCVSHNRPAILLATNIVVTHPMDPPCPTPHFCYQVIKWWECYNDLDGARA